MSDDSLDVNLDSDLSAARARRAGSAMATKSRGGSSRPKRMSNAEVEQRRREMQEVFMSIGAPPRAASPEPAQDSSDSVADSSENAVEDARDGFGDLSSDMQGALGNAFGVRQTSVDDDGAQGSSSEATGGSETPSVAVSGSDGHGGQSVVSLPPISAQERAQRGMDAWAEAFGRFYTDVVADDADISKQTEEVRHAPANRPPAKSRGGRIAADGAPVQIRGISRALFEVARSEFPQLTNAKALEAYIARTSGRFDLVEDEDVKAAALEAAASDGTIAALANEMASMRRSMRALRIEASVASLAAIMNDVDVRSDDVSDQLFVRMRELIAISSAYDDAIRAAQGRLPHGYGD